jgi:putative flippase GtrA
MKQLDIALALVSGLTVAWLFNDIFSARYLYIIFPILSVFCLWLAYIAGKNHLFVFQAAKFFLIGAFATVVDLIFFEISVWVFSSFFIGISLLIPKAISFIVATLTKFWGNKHWAFEQHDNASVKKEFLYFIMMTLIGLIIDIGFFYYLVQILEPQFAIRPDLWIKLSVVISALASAVWSFGSYKFIVFKK